MKRKIMNVVLMASVMCCAVAPITAFAEGDSSSALFQEAPEVVIDTNAKEADFDGIWKCSSASVFGIALDAADYDLDSSFLKFEDGAVSVYSDSEDPFVTNKMEFADGKYTLNLDENLLKDENGEALDFSALLDDTLESKIKELTAGNSSKIEFQKTESGDVQATVYLDIKNEHITFAMHMDMQFAPSTQEELDDTLSAASQVTDDYDWSDDVVYADEAESELTEAE